MVERISLDDDRLKPETIAHHKARYKFASKLISKGHCLDLACGTGYGTEMLRKSGYQALGIDISKEAIDYAEKHFPECTFRQEDILLCTPSQTYDLVTIFEAVEHLPFLPAVELIKKCVSLLSDRGYFALSTPRDINDKYNTFHKSEWTYAIIKNVLGSYFPEVKIYGQDWDTAEISDDNVRENDFYIAVARKR